MDDLRHHPVESVTWYEAVAFCRWLSSVFAWARGARLPTEEEWEYACRAGTASRYWSGDAEADLDRVGWYAGNSGGRTHRVGEKLANPWGLYDAHGNVWEWTASEWTADYSDREEGYEIDPRSVAAADPARARNGLTLSRGGALRFASGDRVFRGGGYRVGADGARAAFRSLGNPRIEVGGLGFRVLFPPDPAAPSS